MSTDLPLHEPHKTKTVRLLSFPTVEERRKHLANAHFNVFHLSPSQVNFDMRSRGTSAMSQEQLAGQLTGDEAYAGARNFEALEDAVATVFGHTYVCPTHNALGCTKLVAATMIPKGGVVPSNARALTEVLEPQGARVVDVRSASAEVFTGDVDIAALEAVIAKGGVALLSIHAFADGQHPFSLANLLEVRRVADRHGLRLVLVASRVIENAWYIQSHEAGAATRSIAELVKRIAKAAHVLHIDGAQDPKCNAGGLLTTDNPNDYEKLMNEVVVYEGLHTYGGMAGRTMEVLRRGLLEMCDEDEVRWVMHQTERFSERLRAAGVPIERGCDGAYIKADAFLPHLASHAQDAFSAALYQTSGVRAVATGHVGRDNLVPVQIPRLAMTNHHLDQVADAVIDLYRQRDQVAPVEPTVGGRWRDQMQYRSVFAGLRPFEFDVYPFLVHTVERVGTLGREAREKAIRAAGYNTFLLRSADVTIDLLTDSGTEVAACGKNGSPAPSVDSAPDRVPETRGMSRTCRRDSRGPRRPEAAAGAAAASSRRLPGGVWMTVRWFTRVGVALVAALLSSVVGCADSGGPGGASRDGGVVVDPGSAGSSAGAAPGLPFDATGAVLDASAVPDAGSSDTPTPSPDSGTPPDVVDPTDPGALDCDPLMEAGCTLPWPSNLYLAEDPTRGTGYTLTFGATTLPANVEGKHIEPTAYRRMDGYGVESPLLVLFPNVDTTGMATEYLTDPSLAADAKVVWFAVHEGGVTRVPYWAELDAVESDPSKQVLFVRPAVILEEGTRYVVAFRGLKRTDGTPIEPSPAFAALRDGETAGDTRLGPRQERFDEIFAILEGEGIARDTLTLAWDFVTASTDGLHSRMLHMRDDALATVGPEGPEITIDAVTEFSPEENADIAVEMTGTFHMPSYLNPVAVNGVDVAFVFNEGEDGMPAQSGFTDEKLWIRIPRSALDGTPHGLVQYGHGQNGEGDQVRGSFNSKIANEHDLIFFACNMLGMAEEDVSNIVAALLDLSGFVRVADRLHQGMINQVLLARAMRERFPKLPEVTSRGIVVNPDELFYSGISQGGIYGATYMAVSQDVTRGHLGVPGNNYSFLLLRSGNFKPFFAAISVRYPERASQIVALTTVQLLWDGVDPVSYMRRITDDPFPGNTPHHVILAPAKGDPQVPVTSNEWVGRSNIGISIMEHYDTERTVSGTVEQPYPYVGSGIVLYAFGNPWPAENVDMPPDESLPDPHEEPRKLDHHNEQMVHFFRTGEIIDVCGGDGCTPD